MVAPLLVFEVFRTFWQKIIQHEYYFMKEKNPWRRIDTRLIYENPWIRLREDKVVRPDGSPGIYGVVEIGRSAGIVALNDMSEIVLVGQWRYTHEKYSWEIPTGGVSEDNESPLNGAKRELREETGLIAKQWLSLGTIDNSNGVTDDVAHLFYATNLTMVQQELDDTEDIVLRWVKFAEAIEMVMQGEITESSSVAAILKVKCLLDM